MRGIKLFFRTQVSFLILAVLLSNIGLVNAIEGYGVGILPAETSEYPETRSWFVYEVEPGTIIKDQVIVTNNTSKTKTLKIAALDGAVTNSGGYTLVGGGDENKDIATWITLEKNEVTLAPKTGTLINFTVKVPAIVDVGSHPGGLAIWEKPDRSEGSQIVIVSRVAARMYLTVPGDIVRTLEIEKIRHFIHNGVLYFEMTMHNKGNVQLTPEADIDLYGLLGKVGKQKKSQFGLILRGGTITSRVPWQKRVPFLGRYVAKFRIHYGEKDFSGKYVKDEYIDVKYVFWIIPWWQILTLLAILILLFFIRNLWKWLIIQKRLNEKTKKHKIEKGETLTIVADLYSINPKKIARFNLLKWPYDLIEGDILLIPQGKMTQSEKTRLKQDIKGSKKFESVEIEKGDTLKDVASFAETSIQEIITINSLRWPYRLKAGQELMIPVSFPVKEVKPKKSKKATKKTKKR